MDVFSFSSKYFPLSKLLALRMSREIDKKVCANSYFIECFYHEWLLMDYINDVPFIEPAPCSSFLE